jgi:hypothetical protein
LSWANCSVTISRGTLLPLSRNSQAVFPAQGERVIKRDGELITYGEAINIAGSEAELRRLRGKKTVQNWKSADGKTAVVPVSALAPVLLSWWRRRWKHIVEQRVAEERAKYDALQETLKRLTTSAKPPGRSRVAPSE